MVTFRTIFLTVLAAVLFNSVNAQFVDDFTDGNYTSNPVWTGETSKFQINGSNELWLNAPAATDEGMLTTASQAVRNASWEFYCRLGFNPSSSNQAFVYLMADNANLKGSLNGYYVRIGNTADEISLYRQDGGTSTKIIDGRDKSVDLGTVNLRVRVTRDSVGNWDLMRDTIGGTAFISEGTVQDQTHTNSSFFGVNCDYTSTRSALFFFDDFNVTGTPYLDTTKPLVDSLTLISTTQLDVYFSEDVSLPTSQTLGNYSVNAGIGTSTVATRDAADSSLVHLTFGSAFVNGQPYVLTVSGVSDNPGNVMVTQNLPFIYFVADTAQASDVVINEFMADPSPVVGLPDAEYVELFNASNKIFDLNGWQFSDGGTPVTLPTFVLLPDSVVLLIDDSDTAAFAGYPNVLVMSSLPALNNGGDPLDLRDNFGTLIDAATYDLTWYQDANKDDGGYSLERINPYLKCSSNANWRASNDVSGGTPGMYNSVYSNTPDTQGPSMNAVTVNNSLQITVGFNEPLDSASIYSAVWSVNNGISVVLVNAQIPAYTDVTLTLNPALSYNTLYEVSVTGLTDCSGNAVVVNKMNFVLPEAGAPGDIIINEVLFDPRTGGDDFVEIYNNTDKYIDLNNWKIANYDHKNDTIDNVETIPVQVVLKPHDFLVLTEDSANIKDEYPQSIAGKFYQIGNLPSYNNDSGNVILLNRGDTVSDRFNYNEDMHFPLLVETEGVTLERVDYNRPTADNTNWHSASEQALWATPGFENSQYAPVGSTSMLTTTPEIFSPDNDGVDDVLTISYDLGKEGYVGSFSIFDPNGRMIRELVNNDLLGVTGSVSWDGIRDDKTKARIGIYIIYFEAFDTAGKVIKEKISCVLAGKL